MNELQNQWYKKWWGILLLVLAFLILVLIILVSLKINSNTKNSSQDNYQALATNNLSADQIKSIEGINNYWTGTSTPKITIVEFGDFACTYCQKAYSKIREISLKNKNTVKFIFRDYPINTEYSIKLSQAARCAGEQGLFWNAYDKLFQFQGVNTDTDIKTLIKTIGVNSDKFDKCYDSQKYLNNIKKDLSDGNQLGITGTPTWFINGNIIKGDIPTDTFNKIIEELNKIL